ncbi:diguanylate cyclase domain-containing protein [Geodermatophilus sp. URMC 64]
MTKETVPAEARETSGAVTGSLLRFVRSRAGDEAVDELLCRAGVPHTAAELEDPARWWSYETRSSLYRAATELFDDPQTMFRVGSEAVTSGMTPSLILVMRALGTPRQAYRRVPHVMAKFTTTSTMEVAEATATSATMIYRAQPGFAHSRADCQYAQGLLTTVPTFFGLPPAVVTHDRCESEGHPACVYELSWERRSRLRPRRAKRSAVELELGALRSQLRGLQSAATDLVSSADLDSVLQGIVTRAAEAVLAPAYLLAVSSPATGEPLVHSAGLAAEDVPGLAATLLQGGDLGPGAVIVDVMSSRRRYGRLAALYPSGYGTVGEEQSLLAAYADHAAAALDLLVALDDARREADRAGALLALAHELAAASDAYAVCAVVAEALPRVVGCNRGTILLWDPAEGRLRVSATAGDDPRGTEAALGSSLHAEDTPELVGMLTDREPLVLREATSSPALQQYLRGIGSTDAVAVPLLAGTTFLGVAAAGWRAGKAPVQLGGDVLARLRGVGDQATTALQKARLLETVRHQATHDALTGLPNRVLFLDRLADALGAPGDGEQLAVLFCDLDRFKEVNDTLGHAAGDELLRQVSARLLAAVRPGDTVGRLSGDEFAIVLRGLTSPAGADSLARRVLHCFDEPFRLEGRDVRIGTSVGVAVHRDGDGGPEQLLRRADAAMYEDKHRDRGQAPAR